MAVPKKKISKSKGGLRRGGNKSYRTTLPNVVIDKTTGEYKLPHHISLDGYYKGKKVIAEKKKADEKQASEAKKEDEKVEKKDSAKTTKDAK